MRGCENARMFLRSTNRRKDGKDHRYYSVVENRRVRDGRSLQKTLLYLGEINDTQRADWVRAIEVVEGNQRRQMALFPQDRAAPAGVDNSVHLLMGELELCRPRQWGACWLACELWEILDLSSFWRDRLPVSRKGTRWRNVLQTLVSYRLIDPGSEWRLHRYWIHELPGKESSESMTKKAALPSEMLQKISQLRNIGQIAAPLSSNGELAAASCHLLEQQGFRSGLCGFPGGDQAGRPATDHDDSPAFTGHFLFLTGPGHR